MAWLALGLEAAFLGAAVVAGAIATRCDGREGVSCVSKCYSSKREACWDIET